MRLICSGMVVTSFFFFRIFFSKNLFKWEYIILSVSLFFKHVAFQIQELSCSCQTHQPEWRDYFFSLQVLFLLEYQLYSHVELLKVLWVHSSWLFLHWYITQITESNSHQAQIQTWDCDKEMCQALHHHCETQCKTQSLAL